MFLKSLDLFGFKSFADRTHIDFSDGITALLGPNGCGKSNVVDAIKWVLAENRSKNLRAEKMEDVIFNGTEKRAALNVAEVALTIDNSAKILPVEECEIELKRRLYRSGENEFFINNRKVIPSEIKKLFMNTGVGKSAYSVMEQGKIDQILSSKPEDRRYLFEEAAGISKSKIECAAAERELENTRVNLSQIEASLTEIKHRYDALKIQAEKTTLYRNLKENAFNTEIDRQLLKLKTIMQEKAKQEAQLKETELRRQALQKEIDELDKLLSVNMDKIKESEEQFHSFQSKLISIGAEKNGKLELSKQFSSQLAQAKDKINHIEGKQKSLEERISELTEEIDEQNSELFAKKRDVSRIEKVIAESEGEIKNLALVIAENAEKIKSGNEQIVRLDDGLQKKQSELEAITEDIVKSLDAKLQEVGYSAEKCASAKGEIEKTAAELLLFVREKKQFRATSLDFSAVLGEIEQKITALKSHIDDYIAASPQFIDELLSPEGIISQKHIIDAEIRSAREKIEAIEMRGKELEQSTAMAQKKSAELRETLAQARIDEAQKKAQVESDERQIGILRKSLAREEASRKELDDEYFAESKKKEDLEEKIAEIQEELAEIEKNGRSIAETLNTLENRIKTYSSDTEVNQSSLKKKTEERTKCQALYEKLSLHISMNEGDIANTKQNFRDEHSRDLMEFSERMDSITQSDAELKANLMSLREKIRNLGEINLMAIDDFNEVKARYEQQKQSFDDTKKSMEDLERVASEIRAKSSEMFVNTYNEIRKNFHIIFRKLMNGGRGELRLTDAENVLTTGIDIYAQPPGKKLENIALLSGGEKTMTAIALLFATYQVRPSPFCLLDEIDAALDDKNVKSFVYALHSFSDMSQYIVITHNKKTVLGANAMLGVTMEEFGISKIIALRLDQSFRVEKNEQTDFAGNADDENEHIEAEEGIVIPSRPPKRNLE